jgi:hypothetical protein
LNFTFRAFPHHLPDISFTRRSSHSHALIAAFATSRDLPIGPCEQRAVIDALS